MLLGVLLGLIYALLSDGPGDAFPFVNSAIIGLLVGLAISILELYVFTGKIKKLQFMAITAIRTLLYITLIPLIILIVLMIARMVRYDLNFSEVWASEEFQNYLTNQDFSVAIIYTLVIAFIINFTKQMSIKLGQGVLWSFITGKYHLPVQEEFIFMFLRLKNSEQIVKKLGRLEFHKFLNDFVFDITESLIVHQGRIHQYVEDEIVVYWKTNEGLKNANCVRAFFDAKRCFHELGEKYFIKYGLVPKFQAGLHIGPVVLGEIGAIKSEISFYGDVMNTTSRILDQCGKLNEELLMSANLIRRLKVPAIYRSEMHEEVALQGKTKALELHSIKVEEYV